MNQILVEGTPPIIYLTINQTIRKILTEGKEEFSSWVGLKCAGASVHVASSHVHSAVSVQSRK
jgi:hypothetical protein